MMVSFLYKWDRLLHVSHPIKVKQALCNNPEVRAGGLSGWRIERATPARAVSQFGRICHMCHLALLNLPHYAALLTTIESDGTTPKWYTAEDQP